MAKFRKEQTAFLEGGMPWHEVQQKAYQHIMPRLRKNIVKTYNYHLMMIHILRSDRLHRKTSATKRQTKQDDDMSDDGMITSSNGNIFRLTVPLCGEFTGHR